jgi:Fe-S oxidoreductase
VPGVAVVLAPGRPVSRTGRQRVVLWTDSFSDTMSPSVPQAAVTVLQAAGYDVVVPDRQACCGLTWISTGQLDGARRRLSSLLSVLGPYAVNGIPILGLEPSCTAVLRSDLLDLFPDDPRAHAVAGATRTLAELLTSPDTAPTVDSGWSMPDLSDLTAVVQPHCHHHSVMGFRADEALLRSAGATIRVLAGCCGLAGNFGMQKGHYDVSVAVAENALLPALRERGEGEEFVADGFSCRTQALQLEGVEGKALVEILAERLTAK